MLEFCSVIRIRAGTLKEIKPRTRFAEKILTPFIAQ